MEEQSLKSWILLVTEWGCSSSISYIRLCRLGPQVFEEKRSRNLVNRTTAAPPTPGPLIPLVLDPPQQHHSDSDSDSEVEHVEEVVREVVG